MSLYIDVIRRPGAAIPIIGTTIATLPIGMLGLSIILTIQQNGNGFSNAGIIVGMMGLGTGVGMAAQGRLIDIFGQPRVLIPVASMQMSFLILLVVGVSGGWAIWVIGLLAFGAGSCQPQVGACLRSLWAVLVEPDQRHVATALSSILFEAPIIMAPILLTALLLIASPAAAVLTAAAFYTIGAYMLAASRASRTWQPDARRHGNVLGALASPGVRTILLVGFGQGILTAMVQVPSAAFAERSGVPNVAPLLYGALSMGSLMGTVIYGARRWAVSAWVRLTVLLGGAAIALLLCALTADLFVLAASVFLVGASIGPVAVCYFGLLDELAPRGTRTEAFTVVSAAALSSFAAAAAGAGAIIDRFGVPWAFGIGCVSMAVTAVTVLGRRNTLRTDTLERPPHETSERVD
ncbi:MFS transporter [Arthrobacter sp. NA-172]|uniref:MFS transporter n=1 Tax=Arthrobacter sp. NA-172 TaxID=3367524 RepID=UPI00375466C0